MGLIVERRAGSGCLHVTASGEFSVEEGKRTFLAILEAAGQCKATKVLFDGRNLAGRPHTLERFYYGEFAANSILSFADRGVSPSTQFAYVFAEPVLDPQEFAQTAAVSLGLLVRAFDNMHDAGSWLGLEREIKPAGNWR
jgi:hypothetical protein